MGKEKATASTVKDPTEKNLGKATAKPIVNIVADTTQKKEKVTATATATATPTSPTVVRMVSLSQISINDSYMLVIVPKIEGIF